MPSFLEKYKGREALLYRKVCLQYGLDPQSFYAGPTAEPFPEDTVEEETGDFLETTRENAVRATSHVIQRLSSVIFAPRRSEDGDGARTAAREATMNQNSSNTLASRPLLQRSLPCNPEWNAADSCTEEAPAVSDNVGLQRASVRMPDAPVQRRLSFGDADANDPRWSAPEFLAGGCKQRPAMSTSFATVSTRKRRLEHEESAAAGRHGPQGSGRVAQLATSYEDRTASKMLRCEPQGSMLGGA